MAVLLVWLAWLIVSALSIYLLDLLTHSRRGLPPGPRPLPLIGSLHKLGDQPHRSLARLAKIHGPLMSLRLGSVTTVVASSPAVAREILQKHDAVLASRSVPDATGEHAKNSVPWLPNAPRWRALRRIMASEVFAPHRLDALHGLRREKVAELVDHVGRLAREGAMVDVGRVVFTTGLNLLCRVGFSRDIADLDDLDECKDFQSVCAEIMEVAGTPNVSDFFPALAAVDLQGARRRMARLVGRLHRVIDAEVDRRLRSRREAAEPRKNDFLDVLLDEDKASGLDHDTIRALFTDLMAAGMNNITNTMEWAMVELLQNPSSMAKACGELTRVIGAGRNIEEVETDNLPYLQAVINETLRMHPPAPLLLPRQADATIEVAGYKVPKGARVLVNVWAMGHDEGIWPEPEKFMPERFMGRAVDFRGGDFELIPFGAGRRICPGMALAIKLVHVILGSLLNRFKWRLPVEVERNGVDMAEKFGVNVTKFIPVCVLATPI